MASAQVQHDGHVIGSLVAPCFSTLREAAYRRTNRTRTHPFPKSLLPQVTSSPSHFFPKSLLAPVRKPDIVPCALRAACEPEPIRGPAALGALLSYFFALQ